MDQRAGNRKDTGKPEQRLEFFTMPQQDMVHVVIHWVHHARILVTTRIFLDFLVLRIPLFSSNIYLG